LPRLERDDLPRLMSWRVGVRRLTVTSEVNVLQSIGGGNNDSLSMAVFRVERQSTELGNVVLEAGVCEQCVHSLAIRMRNQIPDSRQNIGWWIRNTLGQIQEIK
jgi:hypothetical protein